MAQSRPSQGLLLYSEVRGIAPIVIKMWSDWIYRLRPRVSKFHKQIFLFSFEPKNEQNHFLISALASKNGLIQKKWRLFIILFRGYLTYLIGTFIFLIWLISNPLGRNKKKRENHSFFGSNEYMKICFWNLLTFIPRKIDISPGLLPIA